MDYKQSGVDVEKATSSSIGFRELIQKSPCGQNDFRRGRFRLDHAFLISQIQRQR